MPTTMLYQYWTLCNAFPPILYHLYALFYSYVLPSPFKTPSILPALLCMPVQILMEISPSLQPLFYYVILSSIHYSVRTVLPCLYLHAHASPSAFAILIYNWQINIHVAIQLLSHSRPHPSAVLFNHSHKSSLSYVPWNPTPLTNWRKFCCWCKMNMVGNMMSAYSHATCWLAACSNRRHMLCDNPHS